jgi:hypothetical protein
MHGSPRLPAPRHLGSTPRNCHKRPRHPEFAGRPRITRARQVMWAVRRWGGGDADPLVAMHLRPRHSLSRSAQPRQPGMRHPTWPAATHTTHTTHSAHLPFRHTHPVRPLALQRDPMLLARCGVLDAASAPSLTWDRDGKAQHSAGRAGPHIIPAAAKVWRQSWPNTGVPCGAVAVVAVAVGTDRGLESRTPRGARHHHVPAAHPSTSAPCPAPAASTPTSAPPAPAPSLSLLHLSPVPGATPHPAPLC